MIWAMLCFVCVIGFMALAQRGKQKRIKAAYQFDAEPIHGVRKLATKGDLKKAGLL